MIGYGLRKYAEENEMTVARGVAYGTLSGYAVTLSEGMGYKRIVVITRFPEPEKQEALQAMLDGRNMMQEYRIQEMTFAQDGILIDFLDNPGTMKLLQAFVKWFFPLLKQYTATDATVCTGCRQPLANARADWYTINGVAMPLHETCALQMQREADTEQAQQETEAAGSYGKGFLGALLGGLLGALVWGTVLYFGYFAGVIGFLIGWLAEKGYGRLGGKTGKWKVWILIAAILIGVLAGTFGGYAATIAQAIHNGGISGCTAADIPKLFVAMLVEDAAVRTSVLGSVALGLLMAFLGTLGILSKAGKEGNGMRMKTMK